MPWFIIKESHSRPCQNGYKRDCFTKGYLDIEQANVDLYHCYVEKVAFRRLNMSVIGAFSSRFRVI